MALLPLCEISANASQCSVTENRSAVPEHSNERRIQRRAGKALQVEDVLITAAGVIFPCVYTYAEMNPVVYLSNPQGLDPTQKTIGK